MQFACDITKRIFALLASIIFCAGMAESASLSPSLEGLIGAGSQNDTLISVVVFAEDSTAHSQARKAASSPTVTLKAKHERVIKILKSNNLRAIQSLKNDLRTIYPDAKLKEFWIAPAIALELPASRLADLLDLPGVASVIDNAPIELIEPVEMELSPQHVGMVRTHLTALNVPALWSKGLTGRGRLVCNFDTGVEGTHPALSSKWRGNVAANSAAWFAPSSSDTMPFDATGHGTHTMGLMVGSVELDTFGVAPDAEWIGAAVIDQGQTLSRTFSDILAAFEWAVDPDGNPATIDDVPDVILNSWGAPTSILEPCDGTFNQAIDNVEAAGIVTVFAAGNEGPNPQSLRLPANRATTPLNTLAVGAIDHTTNIIATFSSRGPSSCNTSEIKPEVVAPGVGIYSCTKGGGYTQKNGTSMAAPLIAGIAVLLRQYNPDATVEEIKSAIIQSARDLGVSGEDNDYGHGLPDADAALSFIPAPPAPDLILMGQIIGGDGFADPGELFDLFLELEIRSGRSDSLDAYIECSEGGVDVIENHTTFIFGKNSIKATNTEPFTVSFDSDLVNGQLIPFTFIAYRPFDSASDTLGFDVMVGHAPIGSMFTHATSKLEFTVSDFGQFGLGTGSIYNAGGAGFKPAGCGNILYEAGIIVGRNALQLSSSVRDSLGRGYRTDFGPVQKLFTGNLSSGNGFYSSCRINDSRSQIRVPITISQSCMSYEEIGQEGNFIITYFLINQSNESLSGLYLGFLTDFDLNDSGEQLGVLTGYNMLCNIRDTLCTGILPLTASRGMISIENENGKIGLTRQKKFALISNTGVNIDDSTASDFLTVVSFGPFNITPYDSVEVSLALITGRNLAELQAGADLAIARYMGSTGVEEEYSILPKDFHLYQNYPNPFNPSTVIAFDISRTTPAKLTVLNILGQEIATLFDGMAIPGSYKIHWDGTDNSGRTVASGVYFYKLVTKSSGLTRKMLMLK